MFRDESSLAANPHLWSSITEALDDAGWFVLLLSPDAASSEWVDAEVAYWLEHRDPDRIIPVVTEGEFGWDGSDVVGDCVPPALRGVFESEPRWVDARELGDPEALDLKNPEFAAVVADLAAPLRGVPKDELASEEVRQHKRTLRTAWTAGALLVVLTVAAGWAGFLSARNADEARANAEEAALQAAAAEQSAETARMEADRADANAEEAAVERNNALDAAALAQAQAYAAQSANVLEDDPELASLLALLSARTAPGDIPAETVAALRAADAANLLRYRMALDVDRNPVPHVHPDGTSFFTTSNEWLTKYDLETGGEQWQVQLSIDPSASAISPSGDLIAIGGRTRAGPGRMVLLSAEDGSRVQQFEEVCPYPGWWVGDQPFSADGSVFAYGSGGEDCLEEGGWVSFVDTTTWEEVERIETEEPIGPAFTADGRYLAFVGIEGAEVFSYPEFEPIHQTDRYLFTNAFSISPNGGRVAYEDGRRVRIEDVETGEIVAFAEGQKTQIGGTGTLFTPDGEFLLTVAADGMLLVDARSGGLVQRIGGVTTSNWATFTPDGNTLIANDLGGISVWDLGAGNQVETPFGPAVFARNAVLEGPRRAAFGSLGPLQPGNPEGLLLLDATGAVTDAVLAGGVAQLPDGRFVLVETEEVGPVAPGTPVWPNLVGAPDRLITGLVIWDPVDDSRVTLLECETLMSASERYAPVPTGSCADGAIVPAPLRGVGGVGGMAVSPDGTKVAASGDREATEPPPFFRCDGPATRQTWVWDADSGEVVSKIDYQECFYLADMGDDYLVLFSTDGGQGVVLDFQGNQLAQIEMGWEVVQSTADGRHLMVGGLDFGTVIVYSTEDWSEVARWAADDTILSGFSLSPDQTQLVTTTEGLVGVWGVADVLAGASDRPTLLDEIPVAAVDAFWLDEETLGLLLPRGSWVTAPLNAEAVAESVLDRMIRSFTGAECADLGIDPCPTLEALREG